MLVLLLVTALLFPSGALFAFGFEPISRDFQAYGPEAVQTFRLENESNKSIAVRVRILTRTMDENGKEDNQPTDGLFLVYPSQIVLKPKAVQSLKVQWRGKANLEKEECFRILAEQVPVNFEEEAASGSRIRILFRYLGALYVVPPDAAPEIVLDAVRPASGPSGQKGLELVFMNKGRAHAILGNLKITMTRTDQDGEKSFEVPEDRLKGIAGENILPGNRRKFFVSAPASFAHEDTHVSFRFDPLR